MDETLRARAGDGPADPAAASLPALAVDNLTVHYGNRPVLTGLGLSVWPGEIYGILGPDGAGKTTMIRALCGSIRPQKGSIWIAGSPGDRPASRRRIGLVPQENALYPLLTVKENLVTFGRLSGLSRRQSGQALDAVIAATGLAEHADRLVHALPARWCRRANLAAALMHGPSLLLLDEPAAGLDAAERSAMLDVIRRLGQSGLALLFATRDPVQAQAICGRVGFLRGGIVDPSGRTEELLQQCLGGERILCVDLYARAAPATKDMLRRLGFREHPSGLEWSRMISTTSKNQADLIEVLRRTDLQVREIRFREPGLATLLARLAERAMPA